MPRTLKKECIAMLLAGGQGTRLFALTQSVAKPAVWFGGKYRIIDFPLSNCVNSGIDTVGVLTQYKPMELNEYIGSGQPWDLDRMTGGVFILPPYTSGKEGSWYSGTANAIFQNINFIDRYNPEYVLILSGDHVYKMNYAKMLAAHKKSGSDCTIAVIDVPIDEASSFGIMNIRPDGTVYEFEEKPQKPKSTKASMGIYIFTWAKLREYLIRDSISTDSENDFGKNIIPSYLAAGERLCAYEFEGYWKDVGTIGSFWEANMDILNRVKINLHDDAWRIYCRNSFESPHYIGPEAKIVHSIVTEGCSVEGEAAQSVLFKGSTVCRGAVVRDSLIMPGAVIKPGARVSYSIIADGAVVGENAVIGVAPEHYDGRCGKWGITLIGSGVSIEPGRVIGACEIVDR